MDKTSCVHEYNENQILTFALVILAHARVYAGFCESARGNKR